MIPPTLPRAPIHLIFACITLALLAPTSLQALELQPYQLKYHLEFLPQSGQALATIEVDQGKLFRYIKFENLPERYADIKANGKLTISDSEVYWEPPATEAKLSLKVKINHERDPGEYDALMTSDWAIFRGDDVFPAVKSAFEDGARAVATLDVKLPPHWTSIETGWPRKRGNTFRIDNPTRKFDRPTGWMIAGALGTRRAGISGTSIAVSAPKSSNVRRMDYLTFLTFVWPELQRAFGKTPDKLLVVGMDDPMWRGGLSGPNSLFLHADRPVVSENGTSPLIHELTHMITRIRGIKTGKTNDDWIAEGLAEFYSFELLYRAGGMADDRRERILSHLKKRGRKVRHLREKNSTGRRTARAVVLMEALDKEIQQSSKGEFSIDDVTRDLMKKRKVSLDDLKQSVERLMGGKSSVLETSLLSAGSARSEQK